MSPLWVWLELRVMEVVSGDNWRYRTCKAPVKSSPTNQHPVFYRPDALPVAQPTVSKLSNFQYFQQLLIIRGPVNNIATKNTGTLRGSWRWKCCFVCAQLSCWDLFRICWRRGRGMCATYFVKEPNISIYFFFPPITQWCSISDVLFTGGRGVSDFGVLKYY